MKEPKEKIEKQQPIKKFRAGNVSATIWKQTTKIDGKDVEFYNATIERNYKDKQDAWQQSSSFQKNDLVKLDTVLRHTIDFLYLHDEDE